MIINGKNYPSIGLIRAKPIDGGARYELTIFPPGPGPLAGAEPATMVEVEVDEAEMRRIDRSAPHLLKHGRPSIHMF
ncbi:MAG: hypothetical protein RLZZ08_823 [Pseudomonadota bacterium]